MIISEAYLVEGSTVCLEMEEVEIILRDCGNVSVEAGRFEGYIDEITNAPIGMFAAFERDAVYEVLEDSAELIYA